MTTNTQATKQVYRVYLKATPEAIWDAITKPDSSSSEPIRPSSAAGSWRERAGNSTRPISTSAREAAKLAVSVSRMGRP